MFTPRPQRDRISATRALLVNWSQQAWHQITTNMNNILPPEKQAGLKQALVVFATSHPILATLLLSQVAFSGIPLILFIFLTAGIFVFSLVITIVLGLLAALMTTLFCMGLGSIILIPTLCLTTLTAGGVWGWGWGVYYIVQWVGSGDTTLLTRLSILLAPQRRIWVKQESDDTVRNEQHRDEDNDGLVDQNKQNELPTQGTNRASTDLQTSIGPDGYAKKQVNGSRDG